MSLSSGSVPCEIETAFNHFSFLKIHALNLITEMFLTSPFLGRLLENSVAVHFQEHRVFRKLFQSAFRTDHARVLNCMIADDCGLPDISVLLD